MNEQEITSAVQAVLDQMKGSSSTTYTQTCLSMQKASDDIEACQCLD